MANYIRVPLKDTTTTGGPRYGIVSTEDVYDVTIEKSASKNDVIRLFTDAAAGGTNVLVTSIRYYADGGTSDVVTAQDLEDIRNLILSANQNPGSNPIFSLRGEASAASADLEDYQVMFVSVGTDSPE